MATEPEESANPWRDYIEGETDLLLEQAGNRLTKAFIYSRAIEHPEYFKRTFQKELKKAHFGIEKAGYWERVALRALVLMNMPENEILALIEQAYEREQAARAASAKRVKKGPGGPYREVDLSTLEL